MTGVGPTWGPCEPYTTWDEVVACGTAPTIDDVIQGIVIDVATEIVYGLTGGRWSGECTRTVAPCWRNRCWCDPCRCGSTRARVDLGTIPVWGVDNVTIDDETLDNTAGVAYRVEDWRWLVRVDGEPWPTCQGDWTVTYQYGYPVPASVRRATSLLALEEAKLCAGQDCALSPRAVSYTREGMSVQLATPNDIIAQGFTGVPLVDLILGSLGGKGGGGALFDMAGGASPVASWDLADVDA